jgi:hypothetical protein
MTENLNKDKEAKLSFLDQCQEPQPFRSEMMQASDFGEHLYSDKLEETAALPQIKEASARLRFRIKAVRGIF